MKKKVNSKLMFNKSTIANLDYFQMKAARGGDGWSDTGLEFTCPEHTCPPPSGDPCGTIADCPTTDKDTGTATAIHICTLQGC